MRNLSLIYLLFVCTNAFSFSLSGFSPKPNYSHYDNAKILRVFQGHSKLKGRKTSVSSFIGWEKVPFLYFNINIDNPVFAKICVTSLKRNKGEIGWPLEVLVINNTNNNLNLLSKIKFAKTYEDLLQGNAVKKSCSNKIYLSKTITLAVLSSARYTFLGEVSILKNSNFSNKSISAGFEKRLIVGKTLNLFLSEYRRQLNKNLEAHFDDIINADSVKTLNNSEEGKGGYIWPKSLDESFRRNTVASKLPISSLVFKTAGNPIEFSFGMRAHLGGKYNCFYPSIDKNEGSISYVKKYDYVGVTGQGLIAEKLIDIGDKIFLSGNSIEVIIGIDSGSSSKLTINFHDCYDKHFVKKFDYKIKNLPIETDNNLPVLVWPYQNTWPSQLAGQVFSNLRSHYSMIASLSHDYVPRFINGDLDTIKFNIFNRKLPPKFDIYLFPFLQRNLAKFESTNAITVAPEWWVNQKRWAERLDVFVRSINRQVYLGLVDEPKSETDFRISHFYYDFFKERPNNLKIITTLSSGMSVKNIIKASSYTDILVLEQSLINSIYLKIAKFTGKEIWMYSSRHVGRNRDPLTDYRYLPWKAYLYDFKGIGIWNYSSNRMGVLNTEPSDYDITGSHYGLIYFDNDKVYSSKRWEAFKRGMEDIMIAKGLERFIDKEEIIKIIDMAINNRISGEELRRNFFRALPKKLQL